MPGGVYRGIRSPWAEESISEAKEVKVKATVIGSGKDSSVETGWIFRERGVDKGGIGSDGRDRGRAGGGHVMEFERESLSAGG